jgi:hypothetical protein
MGLTNQRALFCVCLMGLAIGAEAVDSEVAPFFGFMGAACALVFSCMGAAYGTAKSGVGVASMGVMELTSVAGRCHMNGGSGRAYQVHERLDADEAQVAVGEVQREAHVGGGSLRERHAQRHCTGGAHAAVGAQREVGERRVERHSTRQHLMRRGARQPCSILAQRAACVWCFVRNATLALCITVSG